MVLSGTAAVVVVQPGTALPTELPEHKALRAGLEPATCRLGVDNRSRSGPQQEVRRGREMQSERGIETARPESRSSTEITEPLRPATIVMQQARQVSNPDRRGWSSSCSRYTTGL